MSDMKSAEENRQDYARKKEEILALLRRTAEYYRAEEENVNAENFEKLAQDLEEGGFSIVVVGEFSAGKSTMLNALMRERLLPSFSTETTATVNFLRHKEKAQNGEAGRVYFRDHAPQSLENATLETISQYVVKKDKEAVSNVDHLDLYLDSEFLKDGVTLVDSPGLNGTEGLGEITEAQILRSHASIFIFNCDHPGSRTDFEALNELQKKVKTLLIVLNKIDNIKKDEGETVETVIGTLKDNYRRQFPEQKEVPEIWPVSAYQALVARNSEPLDYHGRIDLSAQEKAKLEEMSRMKAFEDRLIEFLTCGEKAHRQLTEPVNRVVTMITDSRRACEEEIALLQNRPDAEEIEGRIFDIKDEIQGLEEQIAQRKQAITDQAESALNEVREELSARLEKLRDDKIREIDEFEELQPLLEYLETFEDSFTRTVVRYARDEDENLREKILLIVKAQYGRAAQDIEQRLAGKEHTVTVELPEHLERETGVFEVGLEEMEKQQKKYQDELDRLKAEEKQLGERYAASRRAEKKKASLEDEIRVLRESQEFVRAQPLPPVQYYWDEHPVDEDRRGLLGGLAQLLVGKKKGTQREYKSDSTEQDRERKRQQEQMDDLVEKINAKARELEPVQEADSETENIRWMAAKEKVNEAREALRRATDENTAKIEKKHRNHILKIRRRLSRYCDDMIEELDSQLKKSLRVCLDDYAALISAALEGGLRGKMQEKQERLEALQRQLLASEENRSQRLEELNGKVERLGGILEEASDRLAELKLEEENIARVRYDAL